jgi:hypothetical protein
MSFKPRPAPPAPGKSKCGVKFHPYSTKFRGDGLGRESELLAALREWERKNGYARSQNDFCFGNGARPVKSL